MKPECTEDQTGHRESFWNTNLLVCLVLSPPPMPLRIILSESWAVHVGMLACRHGLQLQQLLGPLSILRGIGDSYLLFLFVCVYMLYTCTHTYEFFSFFSGQVQKRF